MQVKAFSLIETSELKQDQTARASLYQCGVCQTLLQTQHDADACCKPYNCESCKAELPIAKYPRSPFTTRVTCEACRARQCLANQIEKLRTAQRVEEPTTPYIFSADFQVLDGYINLSDYAEMGWTIAEVVDDVCKHNPPCFVHDCNEENWQGLDVDDAIENRLSDWFEDAQDHVVDQESLEAFVKEWNGKQTLTQYTPSNRIIVLDEARFDALLKSEI